MWEERFSTPDYVFGTAPADALVANAELFRSGQSALSVADGEGRNSVYLAERGLDVTALEFAPSAIEKARRLAETRGVTVDFRLANVLEDPFPGPFDAVLGIFIQFTGPEGRKAIFDKMAQALRPGGVLFLHGYTPEQIAHGTGGPKAPENMYTPALLQAAFPGWEILVSRAYEKDIDEGAGHSGRSALIDFAARKPA